MEFFNFFVELYNAILYVFRRLIEKKIIIGNLTYLFIALSCLLSISLMIFSPPCKAFNNEIKYINMIKAYKNITFQFPTDIYIDRNGDIYILDSGLQKIFIFDKDLMPISVINKTHGLKSPICLAVDDKGLIYVSEELSGEKHKGRITVFDTLGRKKKTIEYEGKTWAKTFVAKDMAIDEKGHIYLAGGSAKRLIILSKEGRFISSIQPEETTEEGKQIEADVAGVALRGDLIYLLSEWQGRIYIYTISGNKVNTFGKKGGSTAKLSRPQGLAVDPGQGVCYVIDYMRHTLSIYDSSGNFMNEFGGSGWGPGWFNFPKEICIDGQGRLFIADTFNKRVQVFQYNYL